MARSNIPYDDAKALVVRVCAEIGTAVSDTSAWLKTENPRTRHRVYVQHGRTLGAIETTLPIKGQPGTIPLDRHNGSITCRIEPTLESLERFLRMAADESIGVQVVNRPRPFAVVAGPQPRTPKPSAVAPAQPSAAASGAGGRHPELERRLRKLKERQELAKQRRLMEEQGLDPDLAASAASGAVDEDDAVEVARNSRSSELHAAIDEAGIVADPEA